jgi:hypothetical protein
MSISSPTIPGRPVYHLDKVGNTETLSPGHISESTAVPSGSAESSSYLARPLGIITQPIQVVTEPIVSLQHDFNAAAEIAGREHSLLEEQHLRYVQEELELEQKRIISQLDNPDLIALVRTFDKVRALDPFSSRIRGEES